MQQDLLAPAHPNAASAASPSLFLWGSAPVHDDRFRRRLEPTGLGWPGALKPTWAHVDAAGIRRESSKPWPGHSVAPGQVHGRPTTFCHGGRHVYTHNK